MGRAAIHKCSRNAPGTLDDRLHENQAGDARHLCVACAYWAGHDAGQKATYDRRRSSWPAPDGERCIQGHAAPLSDLLDIPKSQGTGRHLCAVCAWVFGWQAAVTAT